MQPQPALKPLPGRVTAVAVLLIIFGVWAILEILVSLLRFHLNLNLTALMLPTGIGVLKRSNSWRVCAVVFLWIFLVGMPLLFLLVVGSGGQASWHFLGRPIANPPEGLVALVVLTGLAVYALCIWMLTVLSSAQTRAYFAAQPPGPPPARA